MSHVPTLIATCAVALAIGTSASAQLKPGDNLPQFAITGQDGKRWVAKDFQKPGQRTFLYFINDMDNTSRQASTEINRLVKMYGGAQWYGVVNAREDRVRSYASEFQPPYPLLLDPDLRTIMTLGIKSAPTVVMIDGKGRIGKVWTGFGRDAMASLNRTLAASAGKRAQRFDNSNVPTQTKYGQTYVKARAGNGG